MGLLTFIDVLLGLFFVYMVFALIASAVNEAIAAFWSSRAKWLEKGLRRVLGHIEARKVMASPHLLFLGTGKKTSAWNRNYNPSYLYASDLLRALLGGANGRTGADLWSMDAIRSRLEQLEEGSPIRTVLTDLANESRDSVEAFGKAFARWYGDFEETMRSWYRQKTHMVLLLISLVLAIVFNVDSIRIVQHLSTNAETREALAEMAIEATREDEVGELAGVEVVRSAEQNLIKVRTRTPEDRAAIERAEEALREALAELRIEALKQVDVIQATGLPLGWQAASFSKAERSSCQFWRDWLCAVFFSLPGLLISAFAFTLGAPFWFDLLKQIASVRSVGRAPAEVKKAETSKSSESTA